MIEKNDLIIGESVFFPIGRKRVKGNVVRKNKRTATVKDMTNPRVYRVPYSLLFKDITFSRLPLIFENSVPLTEKELNIIADELKIEYRLIFNTFNSEQSILLETVKIKWSRRTTYRRGGYYLKSKNGQLVNEIAVSSSFRKAPKEVVKLLLFHELLHIKFFNHSKDFRALEKSFSNFDETNKIMGKILADFRIKSMKKE